MQATVDGSRHPILVAAAGGVEHPDAAIGSLKGAIVEELDGCSKLGANELRTQRRAKFLAIG